MDPPEEGLSYDSRNSRAQATAAVKTFPHRQGQGQKHREQNQNDTKFCSSRTKKIVLTRFLCACVILLVGYQYILSSKSLSSLMSNNKKVAAAAVEQVGSKNGDTPSAPDGKFLTIVTGASSNHTWTCYSKIFWPLFSGALWIVYTNRTLII